MGVDISVLDFLMKFRGKIQGEVLQLGRQGFHISSTIGSDERSSAEAVLHKYDPDADFERISGTDGFTDNLFRYLGAGNITSMDASAYEGADIVHDLNETVPDAYVSRFHTIFDGGTLEHVFNLPVAFENVRRMLKVNGTFLSVNAANNQLGHGFYQFSPELMWRVFSERSGFKVELLQIVIRSTLPEPFDVLDPAVGGARDEIGATSGPAYILLAATKVAERVPGYVPIQSDYTNHWNAARHSTGDRRPVDTHFRK